MMQTEADAEKRKRHASLTLQQFDLIASMQREVLEFARGERSILVRKVYLQPFFESVREQLEPMLGRSGVELVMDIADKGTARFDEGKLLRVLHNLSRNAAEALADRKKGGRVTIRCAREKDDLVITIGDNGPGIPKEIEHRLFQSFVTSGKKGGTGLGLAIVKKIVEEHDGTVNVHSSSKGASFEMRLPQAKKKP